MTKHCLLEKEWPRPYTDAEYPSVIEAIHRGDVKIIECTTFSFIPLLGSIVHSYGLPYAAEELMSAGLNGIVDALDRIRANGLGHDNLGGYVVEYIHQYIRREVEELSTIRVPGGTRRAQKHRNKSIRPLLKGHRLTDEGQTSDQSSIIELRDLIQSVCLTDTDKEIVKLRFAGYTDAEIAESLKINRATITLARQALRDRLTLEMNND